MRDFRSRHLSETRVVMAGGGGSDRGLVGGVGVFPGLAHEGRSSNTRALFLHRDCSIAVRKSPSRPLVAVERPGSAALASHTHKKEEKVGEAHAKREINRDKTEEGGVPDQPFLSYGVPAGTAKEKKKKKAQA